MIDRERRALELFQDCLECEAERRSAYLDEQCAGDAELLAVARRLLALHEEEDRSIDGTRDRSRDPLAIVGVAASDLARGESTPGRLEGSRLGPWEILERIGAGGMGEVFRGRRADGAFEKEVAIKLLRADAADPEIAARFHRERRVLAALDHENVARLLDAGKSDAGDPYLVMEYVAGERIDECCDRLELDVAARVRLFLKVCDAVSHAHRLGILHRDLKPANILVARRGSDASHPEPKLLDFGIAGLFGESRLPSDVTLTIDALRYMTPAYASPEQLARRAISPASDLYSLGVILYELLTGVPPHDFSARSPVEIERIVTDESPVAPSSSVETTNVPTERHPPEERARRRRATPTSLRRALRGDLDRIVMMALRKEPERRYASVADFADDLRRLLDGRPVRARPDSLIYRTTRFARRNRIPIVVFGFVLAAITTALWTTLRARDDARTAKSSAEVDRGKAEAAQSRAEEGLADSDAVTEFLAETLASGDPWDLGRDVSVREVLDRAAANLDERFGSRPLIAGRIHATIARAYLRLGEPRLALDHGQRAIAFLESRLAETDPRTRTARTILGQARMESGEFEQARLEIERALSSAREALGADAAETLSIESDLAGLFQTMNRLDLAEPRFRAVIEGLERTRGGEVPDLVGPLNGLGLTLLRSGRLAEARPLFERARDIHAAAHPVDHPDGWIVEHNLANLLVLEGRHEEATAILEPLATKFAMAMGDTHPRTLASLDLLAASLVGQKRFAEAIAIREIAVERARLHHGLRSVEAGLASLFAANTRFRAGDVAAAEEQAFEAMLILEATTPPSHPERANSLRALSVIRSRIGQPREAMLALEASITLMITAGRNDAEVANSWLDLRNLAIRDGDAETAIWASREWLERAPEERRSGSDRAISVLRTAGEQLVNQGRPLEAAPYLSEAYASVCARKGYEDPNLLPIATLLERIALDASPDEHRVWRGERSRLEIAAARDAARPDAAR